MTKSIFFPIILVAIFIILVGLIYQGNLDQLLLRFSINPKVNQKSLQILKIENLEINAEVAKTDKERSIGLSNRTSLNENSGMIFVFPKDSTPVFWMKDTKIPLDIIWIKDGVIVGIEKNVQPEIGIHDSSLKKYTSPKKIDYVLEVNGGFSEKNNLKPDQTISGLEQL